MSSHYDYPRDAAHETVAILAALRRDGDAVDAAIRALIQAEDKAAVIHVEAVLTELYDMDINDGALFGAYMDAERGALACRDYLRFRPAAPADGP